MKYNSKKISNFFLANNVFWTNLKEFWIKFFGILLIFCGFWVIFFWFLSKFN